MHIEHQAFLVIELLQAEWHIIVDVIVCQAHVEGLQLPAATYNFNITHLRTLLNREQEILLALIVAVDAIETMIIAQELHLLRLNGHGATESNESRN